jgi:hypothetical protein
MVIKRPVPGHISRQQRETVILITEHILYLQVIGIGFEDGQGVDILLERGDNFQVAPGPYLYKMMLKGIKGDGPVQVLALGQQGAGPGQYFYLAPGWEPSKHVIF